MKLRKNDSVIIIAGKDRGKTSKVLRVMPKENTVLVEGVNMRKHRVRARTANQKGTTVEREAPIHASNVMVLDPKSGKGTRKPVRK